MRLTKSSIEAAVTRYADAKFNTHIESADNKKKQAGTALYDALFRGEGERIKAIPHGWFSERNSFKLDINGVPISNYIVHMASAKRVPLDSYVRSFPETANADLVKKAIEEYDATCLEREKIGERKMDFRKDMRSFASQFSSLKKLAEQSDDFAKCFLGFDNIQNPNLPAVTCAQIMEKYPEIKTSCKGE